MKRLREVAELLPGQVQGEITDKVFTGAEFDSGKVLQGQIFFALKGQKADGHDYLGEAKKNGASCAVVSEIREENITQILVKDTRKAFLDLAKAYRNSWQDKIVIGLTGSMGKTTTKEMTAVLCKELGKTHATPGNYNNILGLSHTILNTPWDAHYVIAEMGISEVGEMEDLAGLARPDLALITNIAPCHLSGLGTVEKIAEEKSYIYQVLKSDGIAIINNRDPRCEYFKNKTKHCQQVLLYGNRYNVQEESVTLDEYACASFTSQLGEVKQRVNLSMPGRHQVMNAHAAAAIAHHLGLSPSKIATTLSKLVACRGRMKRYFEPRSKALLIDDSYNASPQSMEAAIASLSMIKKKDKCLIIADMGELGTQSDYWHAQIGKWADRYGVDYLFAVGNKSKLALKEFAGSSCFFKSKSALLSHLKGIMHNDMVVLIKGSRVCRLDEYVRDLVGADY